MKILLSVLLGVLFACCVENVIATERVHLNLTEGNVALEGHDPVSYHVGTPRKGIEKISVKFENGLYYFTSHENRKKFLKEPEKYIPAYGGWCAWAMLEGEKVKVDPTRFKIIHGITYLYYTGFFVDTLEKWNDLAQKETEENLVKKADDHWVKIIMEH